MIWDKKRKVALLAAGLLPANLPPEGQELDFGALETLADEELAEERGGFAWQGMVINFGAQMRTYLDEQLVLEPTVSWTDGGAVTTQVAAATLDEVSADELRAGILSSGNIQITMGESSVFLANEGNTAIIHRTDGPIGNILINTGNNVNARTEVVAELDIAGFEGFRGEVMRDQLSTSLSDMVAMGSAGLLGR